LQGKLSEKRLSGSHSARRSRRRREENQNLLTERQKEKQTRYEPGTGQSVLDRRKKKASCGGEANKRTGRNVGWQAALQEKRDRCPTIPIQKKATKGQGLLFQ